MPFRTTDGLGWLLTRVGRAVFMPAPALVTASLATVYFVVRVTGGTPNPLVHLAYVPIAVAAMTGGWRAGVAGGIAAGFLFGPLMPDFTASDGGHLGQWGWLIRFLAYAFAGLMIGAFWQRSARLVGELRTAEERHRADALIEASEHRFRQLVQTSPLGIVLFDRQGRTAVVNPAAESLLGTSEQRLVDTDGQLPRPLTMPSGDTVDHLGEFARLIMRAGASLPRFDLVAERSDGSSALLAIAAEPILDGDGATIGASVTLHDVTEPRALERRRAARVEEVHRVAALASVEPTAAAAGERLLTDLARLSPAVSSVIYVFDDDGANRLAMWSEPGLEVSYPARVAAAEADRLQELVSAGSPVRLRLDHVIADATALEQIARAGGRSKVIVPLRDDGGLVGVLLAADRRDPALLDGAEAVSLADIGRICATVVRRAQRDEKIEIQRIRRRVGEVLERPSSVVPLFQPIISLADGRIQGYEALARFRLQPLEPPDVWFAQAERVGLDAELQAVAIQRAISIATVAGVQPDTFLALNVSPRLLAHPAVMRVLQAFPPRQLVLELTEDDAIADYATVRRDLEPYRKVGTRVAIDDAGAGHASFRHITELQPDFIKLDAQLIGGLVDHRARQALVRALAGFAEEIGAALVAEGIERPEDLALLSRIGRRILGQGYAIARPNMPWPTVAPEALEVLRGSFLDRVGVPAAGIIGDARQTSRSKVRTTRVRPTT